MPTLYDLVRPKVKKQELMDALDALASSNRDFGQIEAREVIAVLDRCDPPLTRNDLEMLKGYCRRGSTHLEPTGRSWAAQDWGKILSNIEERLGRMPR